MPTKPMNITDSERISSDCLTVNPVEARLDVCSLCQLHCPLCPVNHRKGRAFIGRGCLALKEFESFLDKNPQIRLIEIANSGEVFLHPELPAILKLAYSKKVTVRILEGVNLNDASEEALEALVKYRVSAVRVAIDGATQETYQKYRRGGELKKVINNVQLINTYKKKYNSELPFLILQCVLFGHNQHEIDKISVISKALNMKPFFKLNFFPELLTVVDTTTLKEKFGYAGMDSYFDTTGKIYMRDICLQLWRAPQINWDGRLLGCSNNISENYASYAFGDAFVKEINNEHIKYARKMLMGLAPQRSDIPCSKCKQYTSIVKYNQWFTPEEIREATHCNLEQRAK